ncbi:MAG TPA: HupE/UreJ family protein [Solimonas sp.]|nr:HupE/UreJ family protein [Solimonas sp.]
MRLWLALLLLASLLGLMARPASAHPLAPALLELRETGPGVAELLWRTSVTRAGRSDVAPVLPADCRESTPQQGLEGDAWVRRSTLHCDTALAGQVVGVRGLEASRIVVILRWQPRIGAGTQLLLDARTPQAALPAQIVTAAPAVFPAYLELGVGHLLGGLDHVLFVLGLLLLVPGLRPRIWTLTAFTAGHSLTLAASVLGWLAVPSALAEFGIALSLLVLGWEAARPARADLSALRRHPGLLSGSFGLLHGLGFAGALGETGLPAGEIPQALLAFNLGIEAGQLLLVLPVLLLEAALRRHRSAPLPALARLVPVYGLGTLAAFWCWERGLAALG